MKRMFMTPLLLAVALVAACGSLNPFQAAEGLDEKAYAVLGTYAIVQKQALRVVEDETLSPTIRRTAAEADAKAMPILKGLDQALDLYLDAKEALAGGRGSEERLRIVTTELLGWLERGREAVKSIQGVVGTADKARSKPIAYVPTLALRSV